MIDLIALCALGVGALIGARRGLVSMLLGVVAILAGWASAWLFYRPVGALLQRAFHLPPVVALPVGGLLVLFVVTGVVRLIAHGVATRRAAATEAARTASVLDRIGGAAVGTGYAAAGVAVVTWGLASAIAFAGRGPDIAGTRTGRLSASVVRAATGFVVRQTKGSPLAARLTAAMTADPKAGATALTTMLSSQDVRRLWNDASLRKAIRTGDVSAVAASPAMQALAADRNFVDAVQRLGLVTPPDGGAVDPLALTQGLAPLLRSAEHLRDDAEVKRLLADPHLRELMASRDARALLADPGFNALAERVMREAGREP